MRSLRRTLAATGAVAAATAALAVAGPGIASADLACVSGSAQAGSAGTTTSVSGNFADGNTRVILNNTSPVPVFFSVDNNGSAPTDGSGGSGSIGAGSGVSLQFGGLDNGAYRFYNFHIYAQADFSNQIIQYTIASDRC